MNQFFPYALDLKFAPIWLAFGVRPSKDGATVTDDGRFKATFGLLRLVTSRDNVAGAHITTGYRWWTAVGARASFVDDGLTFGTNTKAGVCPLPGEGAVSRRPQRALGDHGAGC